MHLANDIDRSDVHLDLGGATGIGRTIAVPHCRTPLAERLRVVHGRRPGGVEWGSVEASNESLPVLGRVARRATEPEVLERLGAVRNEDDFRRFLAEKGV
jgi:PTS system nitrogen regulatory IIA component